MKTLITYVVSKSEFCHGKTLFYMYVTGNGNTWMPSHTEYQVYHDACLDMFEKCYAHANNKKSNRFILE